MQKEQRVIFLIDCQSFYASVEKAEKPQYRDQPVVVAGDPKRRSGIVLAACPIAKSYGITTAERIGESLAKCPGLVVVKPRMQHYIDVSMQITRIYQDYTDLVELYSIDEQFLDVTGSLHLFGSAEELGLTIQHRVLMETGVYIRIGIGPTKVLAKMACDNYAKKNQTGTAVLTRETLPETLWQLPIDKLFMAGRRMTAHFQRMGLMTIGQLARTSEEKLNHMMRMRFGRKADIDAALYWRIANGIDDSPVAPGTHEVAPKSVGHMMTLPRDYREIDEIKAVLLELSELVCRRCRGEGYMGNVVAVNCAGANYDRPTGFARQMKMDDATNITTQVYRAALQLFQQHWDGLPVRRVGVSLSKFAKDDGYQLSLFDYSQRDRAMALERATDRLKDKYGDSIILRAVSAAEYGQARDRAGKIGGHIK
ncbi:DNA polymerase IV [Paenibacillaceae bacterium]|nr:DNA polymerase IV [Paenibacillaceae bacterium]